MVSSGNNSNRGSSMLPADMPPLPHCLPLEPITLGNPKYTRSGELRKVLGVSLGSTSEDHSFGVAHSKPSPPVATEELKHFKESIIDTRKKARDRVKTFRDSIFKLDKYREALGSKKRQRTDLSERSGGANLLKVGSQISRNSHDIATQRLEERTKNVVLNKRVRTSVADARPEGRAMIISRQQMVKEKDRDLLKAGVGASVQIEEKVNRLPAGGEGWDKKMKRKRSVGAVVSRVLNGDRDTKRAIHPRLNAESKLRSGDAHSFRSRSSPGVSGMNKSEDSSEPASSNACTVRRNELDSVPLLRERTTAMEQRIVAKGNNKPNIHEDNPGGSPSRVIKGKISRAPRTGSVMMADSSPDVHSSSGALEGWEQPSITKVSLLGVVNNQKRPLSTASSSQPMAQWVGQRPHKISRTRRASLVSPVSNHDEAQVSSQGFVTSDFSAKISSNGTIGAIISSGVDNNIPKFKIELENVPSPVGLSESEESGAGGNKLKEKGNDSSENAVDAVHKVGSFILPTRKNKIIIREEVGSGMQKQGRSGRGSSLSKPNIPPMREKLENRPTEKPLQTMRPGSDKNKSKSGRPPSKKLTDRKTFTRAGQVLNTGSSDFTGESDDDYEDLLAAAKAANNTSNMACSSPFWKKMESFFASVSLEDVSYLKQQLRLAEELDGSLSQMFGLEFDVLTRDSGDRQGSLSNQESSKADASCGTFDMRWRLDKVTPMYHRVLSALIEEDESEELYHHSEGKNLSFQYASDDSHCGSCNHFDGELKDRDRVEFEVESKEDSQSQKSSLLDRYSSDRSVASNTIRNQSLSNSLYNNEQSQGDDGLSHSDVGFIGDICQNDLGTPRPRQINNSGISSFDCQYQLMCLDDRLLLELQSIGLYPETMPDLAEGEEGINQEIVTLKEKLYQQVGKKKTNMGQIDKAVQNGRDFERRDIEQVAMNQLVEMAYRKRLACRGSSASKSMMRKVSKQVAMAFVKRTLARCQKFEDTGRSCFSEPALQDIIFSVPSCNSDAKSADCVGSGTASNTYNEACNHQPEALGSVTGAVSSNLERQDSHSDNLERDSSHVVQAITHSSGQVFLRAKKREMLLDNVVGSTVPSGVKGKSSERDNSVSGAGRSSLGSSRSERKTKKPKEKTNGLHGSSAEAGHTSSPSVGGFSQSAANASKKASREAGLVSPGNNPQGSSKEAEEPIDFSNLQLHELDLELSVSNDLGGHQDLGSWLNFDEDGLQDHDSVGLEIPMDDLTDLNMIM